MRGESADREIWEAPGGWAVVSEGKMPLRKLERWEFSARIGSFVGKWVRNKNGGKLELFSRGCLACSRT